MNKKNEIFEHVWKMRDLQEKLTKLDVENWLAHQLFTWNWWILLVFLVMPWIIWFKLTDRRRLPEILLFGTLICIPTVFLDVIGNSFGLWAYPIKFAPFIPRAIPFDMSMIPVTFMLLYQYWKAWKPFLIALFVMAATFAFIGEPLSVWIKLVIYLKWNYIYSFLYYVFLGITVKATLEKIKSISLE
jgi:hypothetical protein